MAADLPLIVGDGLGTAGAATVSLIPLAVTAGAIYGGVVLTKKAFKAGQKVKKPKGWHNQSYEHGLAAKGVKTKKYGTNTRKYSRSKKYKR